MPEANLEVTVLKNVDFVRDDSKARGVFLAEQVFEDGAN